MYEVGKFYRVPCLIRVCLVPSGILTNRRFKHDGRFLDEKSQMNEINYLFTPVEKASNIAEGYYHPNKKFGGIQEHLPDFYVYENSHFPNISNYTYLKKVYLKCISNYNI